MGYCIYSIVQRKTPEGWETPIDLSDKFCSDSVKLSREALRFLGYEALPGVKPFAWARGRLPDVVYADDPDEKEGPELYGPDFDMSWAMVDELLAFDYDQKVEFVPDDSDLKPTPVPDETYRQHLGEYYFQWINEIKAAGIERIVYGFGS